MINQKHLFQLPDDIHYLNGGYMSPLLKSVEDTGIAAMQKKRNPADITPGDFFTDANKARLLFGKLVNCSPHQVAFVPSASYGLQNAVNNIPLNNGNTVITVGDEFPSDYYAAKKWCNANNKNLNIIKGGEAIEGRGSNWNKKILENINSETAAVIMSSIHWTDGTLFDLKAIGKRCKEMNAVFIIDGTQSVGALPIDVQDCSIDALVCAGYKWLLGPYASGLAYYSENFNNGSPIEESWLNRVNADNFARLTQYTDEYKPGAARYSVGEHSNFILTPMLIRALEQILEWGTNNIQSYSKRLVNPLISFLKQKGAFVEDESFRTNHMFGFVLPGNKDAAQLIHEFQKRKIYVSVRGEAVRVSTHLYNTEKDIDALMEAVELITR